MRDLEKSLRLVSLREEIVRVKKDLTCRANPRTYSEVAI